MPRVLVAGASGFAGALAAQLLWRHPEFELTDRHGARRGRPAAGGPVPALPRAAHAGGARPRPPRPTSTRRSWPTRTPPPRPSCTALLERGVRVVDLSADYRLSDLQTYEDWYGPHPHPEHLQHSAYGLTELHRDADRRRGSSSPTPAAIPTATLLSLAPLARAGLHRRRGRRRQAGRRRRRARAELRHPLLLHRGEPRTPTRWPGTATRPRWRSSWRCSAPRSSCSSSPTSRRFDQGQLTSAYVTPTRPGHRRRAGRPVRGRLRRRAVRRARRRAARRARRARHELLPHPRGRRPRTPARCSCSRRSTTCGREPPRRRCRTST